MLEDLPISDNCKQCPHGVCKQAREMHNRINMVIKYGLAGLGLVLLIGIVV